MPDMSCPTVSSSPHQTTADLPPSSSCPPSSVYFAPLCRPFLLNTESAPATCSCSGQWRTTRDLQKWTCYQQCDSASLSTRLPPQLYDLIFMQSFLSHPCHRVIIVRSFLFRLCALCLLCNRFFFAPVFSRDFAARGYSFTFYTLHINHPPPQPYITAAQSCVAVISVSSSPTGTHVSCWLVTISADLCKSFHLINFIRYFVYIIHTKL